LNAPGLNDSVVGKKVSARSDLDRGQLAVISR
jgi:hypothetical protein